jgi:O-succinylbenzoate synthase
MDAVREFILYKYRLKYTSPFPTREGLLLRVFTDTEERWGEIAPLPGRSLETVVQAQEQLLHVLKISNENKIFGIDVSLFPSVSFGLYSVSTPLAQASLPLSALLAGVPEQIFSQAETAYTQGYTSAKLKIAGLSLETAKAIIEQISRYFRLRIDANRALSFQEALSFFETVPTEKIDYIEEPTYELDQLIHFPFPFALDESLLELKELPKSPYLKGLVWKPSVLGVSYSKEKSVFFSSACETGIGIVHIASLAAGMSKIYPLGLDTYRFLSHDVLASPLDFSSGQLHLPRSFNVCTEDLQEIAHG